MRAGSNLVDCCRRRDDHRVRRGNRGRTAPKKGTAFNAIRAGTSRVIKVSVVRPRSSRLDCRSQSVSGSQGDPEILDDRLRL